MAQEQLTQWEYSDITAYEPSAGWKVLQVTNGAFEVRDDGSERYIVYVNEIRDGVVTDNYSLSYFVKSVKPVKDEATGTLKEVTTIDRRTLSTLRNMTAAALNNPEVRGPARPEDLIDAFFLANITLDKTGRYRRAYEFASMDRYNELIVGEAPAAPSADEGYYAVTQPAEGGYDAVTQPAPEGEYYSGTQPAEGSPQEGQSPTVYYDGQDGGTQ